MKIIIGRKPLLRGAKLELLLLAILYQKSVVASTSASFSLIIDENGKVASELLIKQDYLNEYPNFFVSTKTAYILAALPFEVLPSANIISSPDVRVTKFNSGTGHTILAIIIPLNIKDVQIKIDDCFKLDETHEGKAKIEFDLSYRFMSQAEEDALNFPLSIKDWDSKIILPKKYDDTEISFRPTIIQKVGDRSYFLSKSAAKLNKASNTWIVFPNPEKTSYNFAKLVLSLLIGIFTTFFHKPALRERKLVWVLSTLVLALIVLGIASYFSISLSKGFEFLIWAAASIPHAIFAFFASFYIILAKQLQATIGGNIKIDGSRALFAEVALFKIDGEEKKEIAKTDSLINGRYNFFIWVPKEPIKYQIVTNATGTLDKSSNEFTITRGDKFEVPEIDLQRLPVTDFQEELPAGL